MGDVVSSATTSLCPPSLSSPLSRRFDLSLSLPPVHTAGQISSFLVVNATMAFVTMHLRNVSVLLLLKGSVVTLLRVSHGHVIIVSELHDFTIR